MSRGRVLALLVAVGVLTGVALGTEVRVVAGFDYSPKKRVERIAPDHFAVHIGRGFCNWFLFRIEGAKGRTLTIDLRNAPIRKWKTLNPVYSYVKDIHALDTFTVERPRAPEKPRRAANGPLIPDTSGQKWHFVQDVKVKGGTLRLKQKFEEDRAWLAMKYPYTCEYNERFLDRLAKLRKSSVEVIEIACSKEGRPIRLVKIGRGGEDRKPCVLLYAREHPTEHDTSWVAEGAIRYLLSNNREARAIRSRFTFLVVPILDPDGAVRSRYRNIIATFADGIATPESLAISEWFKKWADGNRRLDLVFALHNVESNESPHLASPMMEPASGRLKHCELVHRFITKEMRPAYRVQNSPWQKSHCLFRLSGLASRFYGALPTPYEVNCQAPSRHLTLAELREMGARFVRAAGRYLSSQDGRNLLVQVTKFRRERVVRWKRYGHLFNGNDALYSETWCRSLARIEQRYRKAGRDVSWLTEKK